MKKRKWDFAGWVTKNDIRCSDGVVIKQGAFLENDHKTVPLVWQHDYSSPSNVLGNISLENKQDGVYGYGKFNNSEDANTARELIHHGDINSMSIGARGIQRRGNDVVHGQIYEVSLVLSGANPGAMIEYNDSLSHSSEGGESAVIYNGLLIHSAEDEVDENNEPEEGEDNMNGEEENVQTSQQNDDQTIGDILSTLSEDQLDAVESLLGYMLDEAEEAEPEEEEVQQSNIFEGENMLQHGYTTGDNYVADAGLRQTANEALQHAIENGTSFTRELKASGVDESVLKHGITNIGVLFPQTQTDGTMQVWNPLGLNVQKILDSIGKSPFARIKNFYANINLEEARARGYIKGNQKLDSISEVFFRETTPGTIYRREMIDRDDVLDIKENGIDVVQFINTNQQQKLKEEIVKAVFVGDGRPELNQDGTPNKDKISEKHIRPIATDDDLFTIKKSVDSYDSFLGSFIDAMTEYQGSGSASLYMNPVDIAKLRQIKDANGRFIFSGYDGTTPGAAAVAAAFGVHEIVEYRELKPGTAILVNLNDYRLGAVKGGEVTNFDFFDIDFNQYKYLTETRLSGALYIPKSAIVFTIKSPATGVDYKFDSEGLQAKPNWMIDSDPNSESVADSHSESTTNSQSTSH